MFGFIKKLFGGIFAFLGGLLGGKKAQADTESTPQIAPKAKKSNGYYLELDETGTTKAEPAKAVAAVVAAAAEPVKAAVTKVEAVAAEPVKAAVAAVEAAPAKKLKAAKAKAPANESENGKVQIEAQANPPAATNGKSDQSTFAPNYLMPTASNSRRRPGPSLNMFRDMARQVKTPG